MYEFSKDCTKRTRDRILQKGGKGKAQVQDWVQSIFLVHGEDEQQMAELTEFIIKMSSRLVDDMKHCSSRLFEGEFPSKFIFMSKVLKRYKRYMASALMRQR